MRIIIFMLSFLMLALTVHAAEIEKEIAKCSSIKGDLERLECFDQLAKTRGLNGPKLLAIPTSGKGKWRVNLKINPIDDSSTVILALTSDNARSKWDDPVVLIIRCQSNTTELYISWNEYIGSDDEFVATRVGEKAADKKLWSISTNSKSTFYPRSPIGFIKEMMSANKLVTQVTPYNENPVTAIFDITGLSSAIKPLRETCHW